MGRHVGHEREGVVIEEHEVRDPGEATARRMTGSPTLLVDGTDPFAVCQGTSEPAGGRS